MHPSRWSILVRSLVCVLALAGSISLFIFHKEKPAPRYALQNSPQRYVPVKHEVTRLRQTIKSLRDKGSREKAPPTHAPDMSLLKEAPPCPTATTNTTDIYQPVPRP